MELIWTNNLRMGNRVIDHAHKELLSIVNRIARSISAGDVADLSEAFKLLEKNLCAYFVVEGNIAQTLNSDFTQHRLAHQSLLNEVRRIKDGLMTNNGKCSKFEEICYVNSLGYCLIRHIKEECKPLKTVLRRNTYNFNPAYVNNTPVLHGCA